MNRPKEGLMRKSLVVVAALAAMLVAASPAAAKKSFQCNGTYTDVSVKSVLVPANGSCHLIDSTVKGKVTALGGSYFQATGTKVGGTSRARQPRRSSSKPTPASAEAFAPTRPSRSFSSTARSGAT